MARRIPGSLATVAKVIHLLPDHAVSAQNHFESFSALSQIWPVTQIGLLYLE